MALSDWTRIIRALIRNLLSSCKVTLHLSIRSIQTFRILFVLKVWIRSLRLSFIFHLSVNTLHRTNVIDAFLSVIKGIVFNGWVKTTQSLLKFVLNVQMRCVIIFLYSTANITPIIFYLASLDYILVILNSRVDILFLDFINFFVKLIMFSGF